MYGTCHGIYYFSHTHAHTLVQIDYIIEGWKYWCQWNFLEMFQNKSKSNLSKSILQNIQLCHVIDRFNFCYLLSSWKDEQRKNENVINKQGGNEAFWIRPSHKIKRLTLTRRNMINSISKYFWLFTVNTANNNVNIIKNWNVSPAYALRG